MFKNYLKIALRNLNKSKISSIINITGLSLGISCCLLILLYISDELSYDNYHEKGDRIYRLQMYSAVSSNPREIAITPPALPPVLANSIPEIESFVRFDINTDFQLEYNETGYKIDNFFTVDSTFFDIFTYEFIVGSAETAINQPNSIVLTESTAKRIFGDKDPLGEVLNIRNEISLSVSAVIKDIPGNSHFKFDALWSFMSSPRLRESLPTRDYFAEFYSYLLLNENADISEVERKINEVAEREYGVLYREKKTARQYPLQSFKDIHLKSDVPYEIESPGNINNVIVFSIIAVFVLIIACINFINLSTARSGKRAREVGLRKVFGAYKNQIIKQFLCESVVLSILALLLGLFLIVGFLPIFNELTGKQFVIEDLMNLSTFAVIIALIIVSGFLAGSFPAFILSAFNPIAVLKGKLSSSSRSSFLRKGLVFTQFSISIFMIIAIIIVLFQLNYLKNTDLGFDKNNTINVNITSRTNRVFLDRIKQLPGVESVTYSYNVLGVPPGNDVFLPEGKSEEETLSGTIYIIGDDFIENFGIEMLYGRSFSLDFPADTINSVIINETAAKYIGWEENAIGKQLTNISRNNQLTTVVGVVKDFHYMSLKTKVAPLVMRLMRGFHSCISIKVNPENTAGIISGVENLFSEHFPNNEFDYSFLDEDLRNLYPEEEKTQKIAIYFGILAIFITCLGLFGLASFTIEQRTKEIGIRKAIGASVNIIVFLFSKEFIKLIVFANLIAWPAAFFIMKRWMENFAYKADIGWTPYVFSFCIVMIIALLTVSYQTIKAAIANPVDSLRCE
ncbi:ABC transporter permease [Bacteroidota bacterium]